MADTAPAGLLRVSVGTAMHCLVPGMWWLSASPLARQGTMAGAVNESYCECCSCTEGLSSPHLQLKVRKLRTKHSDCTEHAPVSGLNVPASPRACRHASLPVWRPAIHSM